VALSPPPPPTAAPMGCSVTLGVHVCRLQELQLHLCKIQKSQCPAFFCVACFTPSQHGRCLGIFFLAAGGKSFGVPKYLADYLRSPPCASSVSRRARRWLRAAICLAAHVFSSASLRGRFAAAARPAPWLCAGSRRAARKACRTVPGRWAGPGGAPLTRGQPARVAPRI